jgi:uncharacterized SAM-binding protein YcdF (DUF218 family)
MWANWRPFFDVFIAAAAARFTLTVGGKMKGGLFRSPRLAATIPAVGGVGLGAIALFIGTVLTEGVGVGQRLLTDFVMPAGLLWLGLLAAAIYQFRIGNRGVGWGCLLGSLFVYVTYCPVVAYHAIKYVETPALKLSPLDPSAPKFGTVVVLGGCAKLNEEGQTELAGTGDRLAIAAKMWHAGKVDAIICTGSGQPYDEIDGPQTHTMKLTDPASIGVRVLEELGVPRERLFTSPGENTSAEMRHLVKFYANPPEGVDPQGPRGLSTTAWHLTRAMRLAKANGLEFQPLPSNTAGGLRESEFSFRDWIPNMEAGGGVATAYRELLARLVGR